MANPTIFARFVWAILSIPPTRRVFLFLLWSVRRTLYGTQGEWTAVIQNDSGHVFIVPDGCGRQSLPRCSVRADLPIADQLAQALSNDFPDLLCKDARIAAVEGRMQDGIVFIFHVRAAGGEATAARQISLWIAPASAATELCEHDRRAVELAAR